MNLKISSLCLFFALTWNSIQAQSIHSDNGDGTYSNPVIPADFPDPDIIRVGDTYYMVATTMWSFPGAPILKSSDLVNWEYCTNALPRFDYAPEYNFIGGNRYGRGQWATCMKYHNNTFYLLFNTLDEGGFICTSDRAEGPWKVRHLPKGYYDPGLFFDEDGKIYVTHGYGEIKMTELNEDFSPKSEEVLIFTGDIKGGLEGMRMYKINDYYYLYGTYGGVNGIQIALRSKNVFGPFEQKVLLHDETKGINYGIHQGGLVQTQTGEWWTMLFVDRGPFGRIPSLQPVTWVDDWPMVGKDGRGVITYRKPNVGNVKSEIKSLPTSDEFDNLELGMQWSWNHNPDDRFWSLAQRKGHLRLTTGKVCPDILSARNTLTQRPFIHYDLTKPSIATTKVDISNLKSGDVAGLCVFQEKFAYIAIKQVGSKRNVVMVNTRKEVSSVQLGSENVIYFRTTANNETKSASFEYSLDNKNFTTLGDELEMVFSLKMFTGNKFCLFNFATESTGGYVDFDWFHVK
ncbi:MAG: glycoside hydrolase 43 family protein [Bacteroidales bacterium]